MPTRAVTLLVVGATAVALAASLSKIAISAQERMQLGALAANEGIYVDTKGFAVIRGTAKADPTAQLAKLGAQEVKQGAIIVRVADKLYLVDTDPNSKSLYTSWAEEAFTGGQ